MGTPTDSSSSSRAPARQGESPRGEAERVVPLARPLTYVLAVVLTFATLLIRLALGLAVGDRPLLIFFVLPILVSAYVGGIGPGLLSTAVSAVLVQIVLFPALAALYGTKRVDNVQWVALIASGVLISLLNESLLRSRRRAVESERRYRSLFESMLEGYAYCRILYEDGKPVDFVYLHVNEAFERLTGLKDVIGKRVSQVIPGIQSSNPDLFETCGRAGDGHDRVRVAVEPADPCSPGAWPTTSTTS